MLLSKMCLSIQKKGRKPREGQQRQQNEADDPEQDALVAPGCWTGARRPRGAGLGHKVELSKGQPKKQQRDPDEDRPVGFQGSQVADPGAPHTQSEQYQRSNAAK